MPNLIPYDAGNLALHPTETGIDARLQQARRTATFYNEAAGEISGAARAKAEAAGDVARSATGAANAVAEAGRQVEDYLGHREVSMGAAKGAELFSNLSNQWNKTVKGADPNDPSVAAKFRESVLEPALQNFAQQYSSTDRGRQWSEAHVANMRNHFYQKTDADMSTLAGDAVRVNVRNLGNASSNAALKSPDFHTVDYLLGTVEDSVGSIVDSAPNLKGADSARARMQLTEQMKEQIVKAGALGAIQKSADPEKTAADYATRYPKYVNADEARQFATNARYMLRLQQGEARSARAEARANATADFNAKVNKLEADTMPQNAGDPPQLPQDYWQRMRELSTHPGAAFEPGRLRTMVANGEAITKQLNAPEPLGRISHDTTMGLLNDIRAGKLADNGAIYDAYGQGKLNRGDFKFLNDEFAQLRTPQGAALSRDRADFFKRWSQMIDAGFDVVTGKHTLLGTQNMYAFEMDARREEENLRKQGKDPHLVYDPNSENFWGRPEKIAKYRVSMQDSLNYEKTLKAMENSPSGLPRAETVTGTQTVNAPPVPPAPQREVGKTYELPKGRFKWNGSGWEKP